jgi:hypothetical protein
VTRSNEEAVRAGNAGSPADEPLAVTVNLDDLEILDGGRIGAPHLARLESVTRGG